MDSYGISRTYMAFSNENNGLETRTLAESKDAHSVCTLVLIASEQLIQAIMTSLLEEPLDVRTRKTLESVEAKGSVFHNDRTISLGSGNAALFLRDVFGFTLELGEIKLQCSERDSIANNRSSLTELVSITRDKRKGQSFAKNTRHLEL